MDTKQMAYLIREFEKSRSLSIVNKKIKGYLTWQVLKRPLFYACISSIYFEKEKQQSAISKSVYLKQAFAFPIKLARLRFKSNRIKALIVSNDVYQLEKNEGDRYINNFGDHWASLFKEKERVYIERKTRIAKGAVQLKTDIAIDFINVVVAFFQRFFSIALPKKKEIQSIATDLTEYLVQHGARVEGLEQKSYAIIRRFVIEYYCFRLLFAATKPEYLIITDAVGTGAMAAAKKRKIKVIENQHGHFDNFKPDYMLDPLVMEKLRPQLILPDYLTVFGEYFKKRLVENSIWEANEVVSVGNVRIDKYRSYKQKKNTCFTVLIPSQWNVLEETFELLRAIIVMTNSTPEYNKIKVLIKLHPREPKNHIQQYRKIVTENNILELLEGNENIYEAFLKSDMVIGFDSTSLLEAVALEIPTITISTATSPRGMHTYLPEDKLLEKVILCMNAHEVKQILEKVVVNDTVLNEWKQETAVASTYLYENDCLQKCRELISNNE